MIWQRSIYIPLNLGNQTTSIMDISHDGNQMWPGIPITCLLIPVWERRENHENRMSGDLVQKISLAQNGNTGIYTASDELPDAGLYLDLANLNAQEWGRSAR